MGTNANFARYTREEAQSRFLSMMDICVTKRAARLGLDAGQQVVKFCQFLQTKTTWYSSPASTKYHLCVPGGLLIHSVRVAERARDLALLLAPELPDDSVIFCGMFHDIGKIWSHTLPDGSLASRYELNVLKSGQQSEAEPFKYVHGGHEIALTIRDMLLPFKFVDLSDAELQALMYADGMYVDVNKGFAHHEHPLSLITHWADYWVSHVEEGGVKSDWLSGMIRP